MEHLTSDERDKMAGYIDPVQIGELIGTLKALQTDVEALTIKVEQLDAKMNMGKGFFTAILLAAGGAGAAAHELLGRFFR